MGWHSVSMADEQEDGSSRYPAKRSTIFNRPVPPLHPLIWSCRPLCGEVPPDCDPTQMAKMLRNAARSSSWSSGRARATVASLLALEMVRWPFLHVKRRGNGARNQTNWGGGGTWPHFSMGRDGLETKDAVAPANLCSCSCLLLLPPLQLLGGRRRRSRDLLVSVRAAPGSFWFAPSAMVES